MAKFKVGDKVKVKGSTKIGTISRINTNFGFDYYWVDGLSDGKNPPVYGESLLSLANSAPRSSNPVVANALAARNGVARNADGDPESLVNWKRIYPKLKEFNSIAGWLKGEGVKLMNVARNFDDKKFHSVGNDVQSVCEWAERKSAEILNRV